MTSWLFNVPLHFVDRSIDHRKYLQISWKLSFTIHTIQMFPYVQRDSPRVQDYVNLYQNPPIRFKGHIKISLWSNSVFFFCRRSWETFPQKKPANFIFWTIILTNFFPMFPFDPSENIRGSKGNIRKNWDKDLCQNSFLISTKFKWINQLLFFYNFNKSMLTVPLMFFLRNIADHKKTCIFSRSQANVWTFMPPVQKIA